MNKKSVTIILTATLLIVGTVFGVWKYGDGRIYNRDVKNVFGQKQLVGVWQDVDAMGSGWADTYQFFSSGKYNHTVPQSDCLSRYRGSSGTWKVDGAALTLTPLYDTQWVGGSISAPTARCLKGELVNTQSSQVKAQTPVISISLGACAAAKNSPYSCTSFNSIEFYKFSSDPTYDKDSTLLPEPSNF